MPALFDVHLEKIAQVIQRRRGVPQHALLLDRCRLSVALGNDQAAQGSTVLARNLLPDFLAVVVPKADLAIKITVGEEDTPAVIRHANVAVGRPSLGVDRGRGAQVHIGDLKIFRAEFLPPVQEFGLPVLQRALQCTVRSQINVVRNAVLIIHRHEVLLNRCACCSCRG